MTRIDFFAQILSEKSGRPLQVVKEILLWAFQQERSLWEGSNPEYRNPEYRSTQQDIEEGPWREFKKICDWSKEGALDFVNYLIKAREAHDAIVRAAFYRY